MKKIIWIASLCAVLMLSACNADDKNSSSGLGASGSSAAYKSHLSDKEAKIDFCASSDATRYAYASNDGAAAELVVGGASGDKAVFTAPKDSAIYNPQWSPDGKLIAFKLLSPYETDSASVMILDVGTGKAVDTGAMAPVTRYTSDEAYYSWSSDSSKLLVEFHPILYWDVKTGKQVQVSEEYKVDSNGNETGEKSIRASFSPNGKKIAYTTMGEKDGKSCTYIKIYDIARATTGVASYSSIPASSATEIHLNPPVWISDTKVISEMIGRPNWYVVDITSGAIETFDPLGTDCVEAKLSPAGGLLAVVRGNDGAASSLLDLSTLVETPIEGAVKGHLDWSTDGQTLISWGDQTIKLFGTDGKPGETKLIPVKIYSAPVIINGTVYYENKKG